MSDFGSDNVRRDAASSGAEGSGVSASAAPPLVPQRVTGVQIMQGIGVGRAPGFWEDVWNTITKRRTAVISMVWLGLIAFFGIFAPVLASGHPLVLEAAQGTRVSPLWLNLSSVDLVLLLLGVLAPLYVFFGGKRGGLGGRVGHVLVVLLGCIAILAISGIVQARLESAALDAARRASSVADAQGVAAVKTESFANMKGAGWIVGFAVAMAVAVVLSVIPIGRLQVRVLLAIAAMGVAAPCVAARWDRPLERFAYVNDEVAGRTKAVYTLIPWSPTQRFSSLDRQPPGTSFQQAMSIPAEAPGAERVGGRSFILGTDAFGSDVLSQLMHASRLAISIGLVATGVALVIGVTMGALMGYFGGWIDLILYRVVEVFMAVPVLFLLIVAVAVLPEELRTTYVMMAIIGCFTWTGMARFTRAEFMKLRNQDFVQAAQATGLPLWSVLFRHMLPNGIAPVLVDTSFAVAAVIGLEATLSYLGLGPVDSPSWGRLLSSAISSEGQFKWWLAVFPGLAIFMTVLSYNLLGESLRDAIDPKLKKARV